MKLLLLDTLGVPLGALPPFDVEVPWWPEVEEVVSGARSRYGVDLQVLRLLTADGDPIQKYKTFKNFLFSCKKRN
ncbi:hypothetical protein AB0M20_33660 [Actinoplanes sp. NPDC051633]|uniref:hypothetical protein n=1 Tax=Actinoplanes sp. NPDC051633 TaxID=3155670 RepID=UPI00342A851F